MDPDPGGPKTCGSGFGSGSGTLVKMLGSLSNTLTVSDACAICDDFVLVALLRSRKKTEGEGGSSRGAAT